MTKYSRDSSLSTNPANLADNTILALASIRRTGTGSQESLREGIKLCDYLLSLLQELKDPTGQKTQLIFRSLRDDTEALKASGVGIDTILRVKGWIEDLIQNPSSHNPDEIEEIQEILMRVTMPMWQNRAQEFREKKLKRGFIIRG